MVLVTRLIGTRYSVVATDKVAVSLGRGRVSAASDGGLDQLAGGRVVGLAAGHDRIGDPRDLVGQRHHGDIGVTACFQRRRPAAGGILLALDLSTVRGSNFSPRDPTDHRERLGHGIDLESNLRRVSAARHCPVSLQRSKKTSNLTRRFGPLPAWAEQQIGAAPVAQLDAWLDGIFDASSLEDLIGDDAG